ncbi:MAG: 3-phosphoshikimate 1-carboxyvinyltransferase [Sphaerochaetaceae bacterium]
MKRISLSRSAVSGELSVPSSKSETIRALLISTFSNGRSVIHRPLISQDTKSCMAACRALGATVVIDENQDIEVTPAAELPGEAYLDCGNSGTTMYLAASMAASLGIRVAFTGDDQLLSRPIGALLGCLRGLGAAVEPVNAVFPPFAIKGPLEGGRGTIICKTSQFLSSLLLGCPLARHDTVLDIPLLYEKPYVRITMEFLNQQGIEYSCHQDLQHFEIKGGQRYKAQEWSIDGDFSSAAFFFGAAAITGGRVTVRGLRKTDPQGDKGILRILTAMGCDVSWNGDAVTVQGPRLLQGGTFDLNSMPDTLPVMAVVSCFAEGNVHLVNVPQARIKETDRISQMKRLLVQTGARVTELPDGLIISGNAGNLLEGGRRIDGAGDHRVVMAMSIASLMCRESLTIENTECVDVTYPGFFTALESIKSQ